MCSSLPRHDAAAAVGDGALVEVEGFPGAGGVDDVGDDAGDEVGLVAVHEVAGAPVAMTWRALRRCTQSRW